MGLLFEPERLDTVALLREGGAATSRFSTRVLYFETLTRARELFDSLLGDSTVESLVFEAEGKNFLLGADVDYFYEAVRDKRVDLVAKYSDLGNDFFDALEKAPFPTVAKISGAAMGGGFELALACRARVLAPSASLEFPETGLGIFPGWGGIKRLRRLVGAPLAKRFVFTGKPINAGTALKLGIADAVVPAGELDRAARAALAGSGAPVSRETPEEFRALARYYDRPLREILAEEPSDPVEKREFHALARRAPVSLEFAERIFEAAGALPPGLERRFEDSLTWQIYQTGDAKLGLERAIQGTVAKIPSTGKLDEFYRISPKNL